jgi:tRNA(Ile)-lysidine synthase
MSLYQKDNQYVVCSGDHIVWLVNERSDNRFRITSQTKRVLLVQIKKGR